MKLNKADWLKIAKGASLFSTGGGGDLFEAQTIFSEVFNKNKFIELKSLSDLKPEDLVCTAYIAGSIGSYETNTLPLEKSFANLEKILGQPIAGIMPVEIGPGDIAETVKIAAVNKLPVIDADFVGKRSSPEVYLETITLKDLSRTPMVIANLYGETKIIRKNFSSERIEKLVRNFAKKSASTCFVVGYPLLVKEIRGVVGEGTLSLSFSVGKILNSKNQKTIWRLLKLTHGKILFTGKISQIRTKDDKGFLSGTMEFIGNKQFKNDKAKIYLKNENLLFWKNGKLELSCPDLICVLNSKILLGTYNRDWKIDDEVIVLGIPALAIWRSKQGRKLFSPKTFGFNLKPKLLNY